MPQGGEDGEAAASFLSINKTRDHLTEPPFSQL